MKKPKSDAEISMTDIKNNPYIPKLVKELFEPIAD